MTEIQTLEAPQSTTTSNDQTLLGTPELASGKPDETTLLGTEGKNKEAPDVAAENKRLLEADEKTLTAEDVTKRNDLIKTQDAAKAQTVPEKYEVKLPEGMTLNQAMVEKLTPVLKELGVTQANFQKLADVFAPQMKAQAETQQQEAIAHYKEIVKGWRTEAIKELGPKWNEELAVAAKAMDQAQIPGLREMAEETGVGNHPAFVKFAIWAGKMIRQDSFGGGNAPGGSLSEQEKLNVMYPSMKP